MLNSIILSSCLIGSVYIHSKSLDLIKIFLLQKKQVPQQLILMNVCSFMMSSYLIMYNLKMLQLYYL